LNLGGTNLNQDFFFPLARENVSKPADRRDCENEDAKGTNCKAGDEARGNQADPER
jgi:hypothetical protein